jgi:hypothetical protein
VKAGHQIGAAEGQSGNGSCGPGARRRMSSCFHVEAADGAIRKAVASLMRGHRRSECRAYGKQIAGYFPFETDPEMVRLHGIDTSLLSLDVLESSRGALTSALFYCSRAI